MASVSYLPQNWSISIQRQGGAKNTSIYRKKRVPKVGASSEVQKVERVSEYRCQGGRVARERHDSETVRQHAPSRERHPLRLLRAADQRDGSSTHQRPRATHLARLRNRLAEGEVREVTRGATLTAVENDCWTAQSHRSGGSGGRCPSHPQRFAFAIHKDQVMINMMRVDLHEL